MRFFDISKSASVFYFTSSKLLSLDISVNNKPSPLSLTSKTANSVIILFTHFVPVNGNLHYFKILDFPFLEQCSVNTITLEFDATKSIAPPIPLTNLSGIIQLAISPY